MINLLYFYIAFSYLFMLGASTVEYGASWWNVLLAPIILPIVLGRYVATQILK